MPSIFEVLAQEVVPVQLEKAEGLRVLRERLSFT